MFQENFIEIPQAGRKLARTTTILKLLRKEALMPWAAKMTAEYYQENLIGLLKSGLVSFDEFQKMDTTGIYNKAKAHHKEKAKLGADIGSKVHASIEKYIQAQSEGIEEMEIDKDIEKPFGAFIKWWDKNDIEVILSEERVWSLDGGGYTGKLDILGLMRRKKTIRLIDLKSSTGFYEPEYPLQLASYRHALKETKNIDVDEMGVLRLDKQNGNPYWKEYYHYEMWLKMFLFLANAFNTYEQIKRLKNNG